jgi:hypothetical protein
VTAFDIKPFNSLLPPFVQGRLFPGPGAGRTPFRPQANPLPAQYDASVATNATGAFVIAWSTTNPDTRNSDVWAQRYDATNLKRAPRSRSTWTSPVSACSTPCPPSPWAPTAASPSPGSASWPPGETSPTGFQVWARRFAATGVPLGPPVQVSSGLVEGGPAGRLHRHHWAIGHRVEHRCRHRPLPAGQEGRLDATHDSQGRPDGGCGRGRPAQVQ